MTSCNKLPGCNSETSDTSEADDLQDEMISTFAKGVSWLYGVMPRVSKGFSEHGNPFELEASAKDVLQQARKTEKLLKKHGTFTELKIQEV